VTDSQDAAGVLDLAEVRSGLIQLDRRLDELARGLVSRTDAEMSETVAPPAATVSDDVPASIPLVSHPASVPPWMSHSSVSANDGDIEQMTPLPAGLAPHSGNGNAAPLPVAHHGHGDAGTVTLARAEQEAARILARVHQRADEVQGQIDELLRVRDHLRVSTQEIVTAYGEVLSELDRRFDAATPAPESPETVSALHGRFIGDVRVEAGPFRDLGAIRLLEEALAGIEAVASVSLAGFTDHDVQIDLCLVQPCDLVAELERALPFACEIESLPGADLGLLLRAA
jgi:hypothetical protein